MAIPGLKHHQLRVLEVFPNYQCWGQFMSIIFANKQAKATVQNKSLNRMNNHLFSSFLSFSELGKSEIPNEYLPSRNSRIRKCTIWSGDGKKTSPCICMQDYLKMQTLTYAGMEDIVKHIQISLQTQICLFHPISQFQARTRLTSVDSSTNLSIQILQSFLTIHATHQL